MTTPHHIDAQRESRKSEPVSSAGNRASALSHSGLPVLLLFALCGMLVIALDRPPRPVIASAPASEFSALRAATRLPVIARAPHPVDSAEHDVVRDYLLATLREMGFVPEEQRSSSLSASYGIKAPMDNVMCRLRGSTRGKAVLLVAHYDSVVAGPGASDNGVAVAAVLETARALRSHSQPLRDVIFLFTDGEEPGLIGARVFVKEHPWARDAGIVLNFDARGNGGPSIMFETSDRNGWLIDTMRRAARHPVANSLSYEIYKRLPNNTDFTAFRRAGYSGLNFAFIDGLQYYHTPADSLANVDLGSLQQDGDYMLDLTSAFANASTGDPKPPDVVYFDLFGTKLISYPPVADVSVLAASLVVMLCAIYAGVRSGKVGIGSCLLGAVVVILGACVAFLGAKAADWLGSVAAQHAHSLRFGLLYHSGLFVTSFCLIGIGCSLALYCLASKWLNGETLGISGLLAWSALAALACVYVPGAGFLFVWPLAACCLGWLVILARPRGSQVLAACVAAAMGAVAVVIIAPMAHKIYFAFAWTSAPYVSALFGLLLALLIGSILRGASLRRWLLPLMVAALGVGLYAAGAVVSVVDAPHRRQSAELRLPAQFPGVAGETLSGLLTLDKT